MRWHPAARTRKWSLFAHIVVASAWFGLDLALGVLVCTALVTDSPAVAATALQALRLFAVWPMLAAALLTLATGAVLGLGSKYGVVRYWWVAAKLAVTVLMAVLIFVALRVGVDEAAVYGREVAAGTASATRASDLLPPVVVAPSLLLFSFVLSVFKPWGRIRRPAAERTAVTVRDGA
ncbi:hypothetical protein [Amycolatopsis sp. FDAARGOS 1241]|uniref:hypothetical protein n=1 Tax=Amycolatopsis sp. FDAARGOS 1241 TaxID=2778070 RepID=UPI001951EFA5|nr:hypothetical protein [Amycolatopsis sp. FDAARGOS 1241]QRP50048.1 hypothetical protein I6J71_21410 [Amycolatopsis sp. FDAARGOS 1241]